MSSLSPQVSTVTTGLLLLLVPLALSRTLLLVHLGVLPAEHPAAVKYRNPAMKNWRGIEVGYVRPAPGFLS